MKYIVRHGSTRFLGEYYPIDSTDYQRMQRVVIESPRGIEAGTILCEATERTKQFLPEPSNGKIIRPMTPDDLAKERQWAENQKNEFEVCRHYIDHFRLQMDLVDVEHLLGNERIVFYFLVRPPEKRVDFRE